MTKSNNSDTEVDYLDIKIKSDSSNLIFSLYDKRDAFNFEIINFPYLDSCIPRRPSLGIFYGQLIRIARICSKYEDFCFRTQNLTKRLLNQGYRHSELMKLTSKFYKEKSELIVKYSESSISSFTSKVVFK